MKMRSVMMFVMMFVMHQRVLVRHSVDSSSEWCVIGGEYRYGGVRWRMWWRVETGDCSVWWAGVSPLLRLLRMIWRDSDETCWWLVSVCAVLLFLLFVEIKKSICLCTTGNWSYDCKSFVWWLLLWLLCLFGLAFCFFEFGIVSAFFRIVLFIHMCISSAWWRSRRGEFQEGSETEITMSVLSWQNKTAVRSKPARKCSAQQAGRPLLVDCSYTRTKPLHSHQ